VDLRAAAIGRLRDVVRLNACVRQPDKAADLVAQVPRQPHRTMTFARNKSVRSLEKS